MSELVLYHYWRSSASWRVRWALELKKVPHKSTSINLLAGEEKNPTYLKHNPAGYVPCLITADGPLGESLAILEWLEENYPAPALLPQDSWLRARARQLAETVNAGTQPLQNTDVAKKLSNDAVVQGEWITHWITRGLGVFEALLADTRKIKNLGKPKFCLGDSPGIADICLIPQCFAADRFKVSLANFPECQKIYQYALSTTECHASHPERYKPN